RKLGELTCSTETPMWPFSNLIPCQTIGIPLLRLGSSKSPWVAKSCIEKLPTLHLVLTKCLAQTGLIIALYVASITGVFATSSDMTLFLTFYITIVILTFLTFDF